MLESRIRRLGCLLLLAGAAAASAQERVVAPLPSLAPLVERVAPAVVNISVTEIVERDDPLLGGRELPPFFEDFEEYLDQLPPERQGAGSGVIIDADNGYVLTNHHVIADASEIQVVLTDNRRYDAAVIGSDPESDVAILQISAPNLTAVGFASTAELRVGDYVVAIGNPFGLGQTVTSGIVSALGRTSGIYYSGGNDGYEDFIQTDASINVGNSGGALINLNGELVGINSAIISRTGGSVGIGFAIPSEMVISVMGRLLEFGEVPRGLLGVAMETVTPDFASDYGLTVDAGALVFRVVAGSAAEEAGIRVNDVIVGVDGEPITNSNELRNRIAMRLPGEAVDIELVRDGRSRTLTATLAAKPAPENRLPARRDEALRPSVFNGIELVAEAGNNPGLRVVSIDERTASLEARRLVTGDLIKAVNGRPVRNVADATERSADARNVVVEIERDSRPELIRLR